MTRPRVAAATAAFTLGVALLPFARVWGLSLRGKDVLAADACFLVSALLLVVELVRRRRALRFSRFHALVAVCVASVALSVITSEQVGRSAVLAVQRLYAIGLAVLAFHVVADLDELRLVVRGWVAGGVLSAVLMIGGALAFFAGARTPATNPMIWNMGSLPDVGLPRVTGLMSNANAACNLLVSTAAMAVGLLAARSARPRWWLALAVLVSGAAAFTMSPGLGSLALLIGASIWLLFERSRMRVIAGVALGGAVLAAILMLLATSVRLDAGGSSPESSRLLAWQSSFATFRAHPLFGRGIGLEAATVDFATPRGVREHLTSAHNAWLSVAAQQGLVGLLSMGLLFGWLGKRAWPARLSGELPALTCGLALALFVVHGYQSLSLALENQRHFWIAAGLLAACLDGIRPVEPAQIPPTTPEPA